MYAGSSMTGTDLGGFNVSTRIFYVTGRDLKLHRRWRRSRLGQQEKSEFSISIHGLAVGDPDDVCVIGTPKRSKEFDLVILRDYNAKKTWERVKRNYLDADRDINGRTPERQNARTPERRIRDLQYEALDKRPPTATLFASDNSSEPEDGWSSNVRFPRRSLTNLWRT